MKILGFHRIFQSSLVLFNPSTSSTLSFPHLHAHLNLSIHSILFLSFHITCVRIIVPSNVFFLDAQWVTVIK